MNQSPSRQVPGTAEDAGPGLAKALEQIARPLRLRWLVLVVHVKEVAVIATGPLVHRALSLIRSGLREHHFFDEPPEEVHVIHRRVRFVTSTWARFL